MILRKPASCVRKNMTILLYWAKLFKSRLTLTQDRDLNMFPLLRRVSTASFKRPFKTDQSQHIWQKGFPGNLIAWLKD